MESFNLDNTWSEILNNELSSQYMKDLKKFIDTEIQDGKIIYPKLDQIFEAFYATSYDKLKVVIIGQDPYHGPDQAHGMCFSVNKGIKIPPSLVNIYKELQSDIGAKPPEHGYLKHWADQGVLLLNSVLTVEKAKAGSHQKKGWEIFTDYVIQRINLNKENIVFLLWGSPAQKKGAKINKEKHYVLEAPHPSPLSSYRGFFGCKHFSKCNEYLRQHDIKPIDWEIKN